MVFGRGLGETIVPPSKKSVARQGRAANAGAVAPLEKGTIMYSVPLDIALTVAVGAGVLAVGEWIKKRIPILARFFIPSAVVGGLLFALLALIGFHQQWFEFTFNADIRSFFLLVFFTTIGFSASFDLLKKGGLGVLLFLLCALMVVVLQNFVGVGLASMMGLSPLFGLSAGSLSLTGGHGTSAAFGPLLEQLGAAGAFPAAIAASTWGLVFGSLIGGPVGLRLLKKYGLKSTSPVVSTDTVRQDTVSVTQSDHAMLTVIIIAICIGVGTVLVNLASSFGLVLPAYLGPMLVAALVRNIMDFRKTALPISQFDTAGNLSLSLFLVMALMSMKLWELAAVAGPLVVILIAQTLLVGLFAYFVTFRVMGSDYDAVILSAGHCGFGLGATPNAMANMEALTAKTGPSVKAFFVLPLVGSLFIDFFNAAIITTFISFLK
jgi:ESS family glutamate:Na+ symporter